MSSRKLQQEFDKLQKKVTEGLASFEEIYEKIGICENSSQKDKLEGDLRKEIKKLQRSRDQVKQWLSDSGNKLDKEVLLDTRSRIENAMERFKEVEKVLKMKQFSNEGLELQTKLGARGVDEAKKNDAAKYVVDVLDELARQNELLSAEVAQLLHKKKLGAAQAQVADLTAKLERNNAHVLRLEEVLRNVENQQLAPEKIDAIKDDLDYYVENNQLPDFIEYDDFYDVLELEEVEDAASAAGLGLPATDSAPPSPQKSEKSAPEKSTQEKSAPEKGTQEKSQGQEKQAKKEKPVLVEREKKPDTRSQGTPVQAHPRMTITIGNSITNAHNQTQQGGNGATTSASTNSAGAAGRLPPGLSASKPGTPVQAQGKLTVAEELKKKALSHAAVAAGAVKSPATRPTQASVTPVSASAASHIASSIASNIASNSGAAASALASPVLAKDRSQHAQTPSRETRELREQKDSREHREQAESIPAAFWDNSANIAALASARLNNPLPFHAISAQLEASLLNCPDSFDSERPRQYNPTNVHPSSVDYPQEPMFELNSAAVMRRFDTDTLFFCFYYNETQDALAKWHAARELSRRGWVFNLATKQWFSKEDRPKSRSTFGAATGANGESGTAASFKYFDYESSWLVRRKDNFEFERELQRTF